MLRGSGDFEVMIWGVSHKGMGSFLWGGVDSSRHHVKILVWQLMEG